MIPIQLVDITDALLFAVVVVVLGSDESRKILLERINLPFSW